MSAIDHIKETITIIEAFEQYTNADFSKAKIHKSQFNIVCPWHDDRSPSLTIYTNTNTFYCWSGCNNHKKGDVLDVVRLSQDVAMKEAIRIVTKDFNLSAPNSKEMQALKKKRASKAYTAAQKKQLTQDVSITIDKLKNLKHAMTKEIKQCKSIEVVEEKHLIYHLLAGIEHWLDCLISNAEQIQQNTLIKVKEFFHKTRKGVKQ